MSTYNLIKHLGEYVIIKTTRRGTLWWGSETEERLFSGKNLKKAREKLQELKDSDSEHYEYIE